MAGSRQSRQDEKLYLVINDPTGAEERIVLHPDQVTDVGRAGTNRVVLRDEICSRNHCEIFRTSTGWMLRDRDSRNGTFLNETRVERDRPLIDGDIIRIGETMLLFTTDENASLERHDIDDDDDDTAMDLRIPDETIPLPEIIHSQKESSLRGTIPQPGSSAERTSAQLSRLYQIALQMGEATTTKELCNIVLNGLVGITGADIGAVLLLPARLQRKDRMSLTLDDFEVASFKSENNMTYQGVSATLTRQVVRSEEAILARDVLMEADLASRDSLGEIHAQSLIIVPIKLDNRFLGLIHLYSTNPDNVLNTDGLDYSLAVADQLAIALKNLHRQQALESGLEQVSSENKRLREQLEIESELVGESQLMQQLRNKIAMVAPNDTVVLIRGESGVGKELVARAIHFNSKRKAGPFVCLNCAALSESLLESELFGHEKGAFTGATEMKHGKFEQAHRGTLFLDEVGEMSQAIQAKFLRVLEGHAFERVGGATSVKVDVRLVAATNRDLEQAVRQKDFRKDLYFRLQVLEIVVPPLRDRMEDVPILARFFAQRFAQKSGRRPIRFSTAAINRLVQYEWPGNVRELQNTIERAVVLCEDDVIQPEQIMLSRLDHSPLPENRDLSDPDLYDEVSIEEMERKHIIRTLELTAGNKSRAAQILGIERSTLDRKIKKYRIQIERD